MERAEAPGVAETRHRMANNQQLLAALARLRAQRSSEPEAARQLLWIADAIGLLGVLERRRADGGVDFAALLAEMAPIWRRRYAPKAELVIVADDVVAPDAQAATLALIVQELTANALIHGRPIGAEGRVEVRISTSDGRFVLEVTDQGPGLAAGAPEERFGLWLVRSLAGQARGAFTLEGGFAGAVARLEAPL